MAGIKIPIDVSEAKRASEQFRTYMRAMGRSTKETEKETKKLERLLKKRLGVDPAKKALKEFATSAKLSRLEVARLQSRAGNLVGAFKTLGGSLKATTARLLSMKTMVIGLAGGYGLMRLSGSFLNAATTAEGFKVRLNALLGSAEEGNKLFQAMAKYAGEVPFQYQEIMDAATALSGVMQGGVKEIERWMPMIGDLAAASGLDIQTTTSQIIRMYSAGASAADLFRERGILAMMGFTAGVRYSVEDTKRMMFEAWEAAGSKFKGVTKELAKTWEGSMSMIQDKWFQFRNLVMDAGIFDALKEALKDVNVEFERWIKNNEEIIQQRVPEYVKEFKKDIKGVWSFISSNKDMLEFGVLGLALFGRKGAVIAAGIGAYSDALRKWSEGAADVNRFQEKRISAFRQEIELIKLSAAFGGGLSERDKESIKILEIRIAQEEKSLSMIVLRVNRIRAETELYDKLLQQDKERFEIASRGYAKEEVKREKPWTKKDIKDIDKLWKMELKYANLRGELAVQEQKWKEEIWKKEEDDRRKFFDKQLDDIEKLYEAEVKAASDRGVLIMMEHQWEEEEWEKHSKKLITLTEHTANSMQDTFGSLFFDAMEGELKSFEDYWRATLSSINRAVSHMLSQMAIQGMFGEAGGGTGGGWIGWLAKAWATSGAGGGMQQGGIIPEPVFGFGKSGKSYSFAERGPERVTPTSGKPTTTMSVVNNISIQTPDGNLSRESLGQLETRLGRAMQRSLRRNA